MLPLPFPPLLRKQANLTLLNSQALRLAPLSWPSSLRPAWLYKPRHIAYSLRRCESGANLQWVPHTDRAGEDGVPAPPNILDFTDKPDAVKEDARKWVRQFIERGGIPKKEFEIGYSRSSGPGGQHVNKTSTKATVRLPLKCRWIPQWSKTSLRAHPTYYIDRTDSLQVSSDVHRSQSQNLSECLKKINLHIEQSASNSIPKPPDLEKQKRIAKHEAKFEREKKEFKQYTKMIKQGRGKVRPE
ncbi:hypothetical protein BDV93DRAFT_563177 [Ceratobasidium sp. AG-I]|nr:hypothetical protein BDV93DRAFT_563177 [Ceratobasidium sp. AG-I]